MGWSSGGSRKPSSHSDWAAIVVSVCARLFCTVQPSALENELTTDATRSSMSISDRPAMLNGFHPVCSSP